MGATPVTHLPFDRSDPQLPHRLATGAPNPAAGTVAVAIAVIGGVLFAMVAMTAGPSWAATSAGVLLFAGLAAATYSFTDASVSPRDAPPSPPPTARLPFCPYCGRLRRRTGAFCHTCGQRPPG